MGEAEYKTKAKADPEYIKFHVGVLYGKAVREDSNP